MKKNGILKQFFKVCKEDIALGIQPFVFFKFLYFPKQMGKTFLLGKSPDGIVGGKEVGTDNACVKLSEMGSYNFNGTMLVNMIESDALIDESPEPGKKAVILPSCLVDINRRGTGQHILESIVKGLALSAGFVVKADNGSRSNFEVEKLFENPRNVIIRNLDFISEESDNRPDFRADHGVGDFTLASTMNNFFACRTPEKRVDIKSILNLSILNVLLNMFRGVVARGDVFIAAMRTFIQIDIHSFINMFRSLPPMPLMPIRSTALFLRGLVGNFLFLLLAFGCKWGLFCLEKFGFKDFLISFKFLNSCVKLLHLVRGKVHGKFKFIHSLPEICSFGKNFIWNLTIQEYTKMSKGTIWTARIINPILRKIKTPNPHLDKLSACTEKGKKFHISGNCERRSGD